MAASATRRLRDGMLSVGSVSLVVAAMTAIDETFRGALVGLFNGRLPIVIARPDLRIPHVTRMLTDTIGLPSGNQFPLLGFALVAVVLFVVMFRS